MFFMSASIVVGTQWGDEGKGKVIDILASEADVVVRSQGGNNAGHTVASGGETYKLRLIPSGILYKNTLCLIGAGVVLNPKDFLGEIEGMKARGISCDNLRIDPRCHIVLPWHTELDGLSESYRGGKDIGTTKRGIGPAYMDKYERSGIRFHDLVVPEIFAEKARATGKLRNAIIKDVFGGEPVDIEKMIEEYTEYGRLLAKYEGDVSVLTYNAAKENKKILFEGAQATLLDIDFGTYPYVTSSHPLAGGVCVGTGVGPKLIDRIYGVSKAYTTRVGKGPFPTEMFDKTGDYIRDKGGEYGTNTGRPRRIGWFDAVLMRHAVRVNGLTDIVVNKLDTLSDIDTLKVCTAYKCPDGTVIHDFPPTIEQLEGCEPVYEEHKGFTDDISGCRSFEELPAVCREYISRLEELCECRISMVGVGPDREQIIRRELSD